MLKTIKNDKEFPVTVKYQDADGKDQEVAIEAGKEIEVPEATAEGVTQQIADAKAPEAEETAEEKTAREAKEAEDANVAAGKNPDGTEKTPDANAANPGSPEGGEAATNPGNENAALSKAEREELETLRSGKAETMFSKLLAEGKVVPAQKEAVLALSKTSTPEAIEQMFSNAKPVIDFSEQGSQNNDKGNKPGEGADKDLNKNVKQWSDLSETEQAELKNLNVSEESYNATALANPQHYQKPASK